jgi:hypothetical protein
MMHASERPKPMREINPTVPDAPKLEALIFRALEKDRGRRFRTAREFADELERILPTLPETGGAAQIPVATEVTDEVTRGATADVQTVLTKPLERTTGFSPSNAPPGRAKARRTFAIVAVLAVLIAGAFAVFNRHREEPVITKPKPVAAASIVPLTRGRVAINAFPWGEITAVKNAETGQSIDIAPNLFTPAPLELAPGRYEITLRNPEFPTAITKTIEVTSERDATLDIQFRDPASAPLPDFGASQ